MEVAMQKHGEGQVLPEEEVQKTASTETPEEREQRLAALAQENAEADR